MAGSTTAAGSSRMVVARCAYACVCGQTVSVDFVAKQIPIPQTSTWVELYLFDCAGQSIFNQRNLNSKHVSRGGRAWAAAC